MFPITDPMPLSARAINEKGMLVYRLACIALLLLSSTLMVADAQSSSGWTDPIRLELLTSDSRPSFPAVTADSFGRVHVVAVRNFRGEGEVGPSGAVFYTRWDGTAWSAPNDILMAPNQMHTGVESLVAADDGGLHLLWTELNGGLFWSRCQDLDATSAHAWATTNLVLDGTAGDLVVRGTRDIAVVYIRNNQAVVFRRTLDGGETWPSEVVIWWPPTVRQATFTVRMALDDAGVYHAAWTETDASLTWNPSSVWYARSIDGGASWQDFLNIRDEGSYINVGLDAYGHVHLLWNHNVGSEDGRYHSFSTDGGQTWSDPQWIFPGLSGRTGFPRMILDSAGDFHQFTSGRGNDLDGGVYHSTWLGDHWNDPLLISKPIAEDNNEGPAVAITSGNLLHVAYRNLSRTGDIMYTFFRTTAPAHAPVPRPTAKELVAPTATPVNAAAMEGTSEAPVAAPQRTPLPPLSSSPPRAASFMSPLLAGTLPTLILLAASVMWAWRQLQGR